MERVRRFGWLWSRSFLFKTLLLAILIVWPLVYSSGYATRVMISGGLSTIVTIGVVIILGQAGQLSFAHSAFYAIGAYTSGLLTVNLSWPAWTGLVLSGVVAGAVGLFLGRPVLKLRYFYLALATIGLGQIVVVLVIQLRRFTGSTTGLAPVPNLKLGALEFSSNLQKYYLVWAIAIVVILFVDRALTYRMGRALRAIASSEIASSTLGVRTANWKLIAFVSSAVICGIAGGLYGFVYGSVSPNAFSFAAAILPIVMMLLGGGTVWGSVVGAIVMSWVVNGFQTIGQYTGVAYSLIMILLLVFLPGGFMLRPDQRARILALLRREKLREPRSSTECGATAAGCHTVALPVRTGGVTEGDTSVARPAPPSGAALLEVHDLSVHFGGLSAVDKVTLRVHENQIVALIGPNGAGKTTFFNVVSRLQKPTKGRVLFTGKDVTRVSTANTARLGMGRTFQNLRLYVNMTVLENVLIGCHRHERSGFWAGGLGLPHQRSEEKASRQRAMRALAMVGLEACADRPAASLPYGSQRLVEIARALASEPRLLLLDEPAAGMNASERAFLVDRIRAIRDSGVTVLLVEHDINLVMGISDYMYVLDYGRLIAEGKPEEVQNNPAVVEAYLGVKLGGDKDLCPTRGLASAACPEPEDLLTIRDLVTCYGSIQALRSVSLNVPRGEVVAVLGANGAGKTTLLRTVSGLIRPRSGSIVYEGADITRVAPDQVAARGMCQVPEGRRLFRELSVRDNLLVGSSARKDRSTLDDDIAYVYDLFPILGTRRKQLAATLSGGEQQMLAIARALIAKPQLLLLDEPSMGLAPLLVERIYEALAELSKEGLTMVLVEQSAEMALSLAHRAVVLQTGSVVVSGLSEELRSDERVRTSYLGAARL